MTEHEFCEWLKEFFRDKAEEYSANDISQRQAQEIRDKLKSVE